MSANLSAEDLTRDIIRRLDELKDHLELYQKKVEKMIAYMPRSRTSRQGELRLSLRLPRIL